MFRAFAHCQRLLADARNVNLIISLGWKFDSHQLGCRASYKYVKTTTTKKSANAGRKASAEIGVFSLNMDISDVLVAAATAIIG